jgi:hypothetical protein
MASAIAPREWPVSHSNTDLGIEPRRVCAPQRLLSDDLGQMAAIDRGRCHGLRLSMDLTARKVRLFRIPEPGAFRGDRRLQIRVRDLETVLRGQLDARPLESLVAVDGDVAPLLCTQLEGGQHARSPTAVMDIDRLAAIGESGCPAPEGLRLLHAPRRHRAAPLPELPHEALAQGPGPPNPVPRPPPHDRQPATHGWSESRRRTADPPSQRSADHHRGLRPPRSRLPARGDRSPLVRDRAASKIVQRFANFGSASHRACYICATAAPDRALR